MAKVPKLEFIMERTGPGSGPENFALWACRGAGKGCTRNVHRNSKKHCEDCVLAGDASETLEQLQKRLLRGDG